MSDLAPTPPTEEPRDVTGDIARMIVNDWLRHLGYTDGQIALTDQPRQHTDECELTEHGWECFDEDLRPFHPEHNEADDVAELVMFVLEHETLAALDARYERVVAQRDEARQALEKSNEDLAKSNSAGLEVTGLLHRADSEGRGWLEKYDKLVRDFQRITVDNARLRSDLNQATAVVEAAREFPTDTVLALAMEKWYDPSLPERTRQFYEAKCAEIKGFDALIDAYCSGQTEGTTRGGVSESDLPGAPELPDHAGGQGPL